MAVAAQLRSTDEIEEVVAWVLRRVGFGATTDELDRAGSIGLERYLDELFEPDSNGIPDDGDPWANLEPATRIGSREDVRDTVLAWMERMQTASRPVHEWLSWFWHGHLVTSISVVKSPLGMANQIQTFRELGGGPLRALLRAITIDPAMLRYLDGNQNTGRAPNENYSRELLELFALGVGNYTEQDVLAGARALSGYTQRRGAPLEVQFVNRRHDNSPQTYLGAEGVHDLDSVIDAVMAHPACPDFIAHSLGDAILGPAAMAGLGETESTAFSDNGFQVLPLVRSLVEQGISGRSEPVALAPVPWIITALRTTKAELRPNALARLVRSGGQVPLSPPNVSGWPTGDAWFSTSATAARLVAAKTIADATPDESPALGAANGRRLDELARVLGRPQGFTSTTADALLAADVLGKPLLALALSTPDMAVG